MAGSAKADSMHGSIEYKFGSQDKGAAAITAGWGSERGKHDGNGDYKLDFRVKVGKEIAVYSNGKLCAEIKTKGETKVDNVIPDSKW